MTDIIEDNQELVFYETREIELYNKYKEIKNLEKTIKKIENKYEEKIKKKEEQIIKIEDELKKIVVDFENDQDIKKQTDEYQKKLDTFHIEYPDVDLIDKYDGIKLICKQKKKEIM